MERLRSILERIDGRGYGAYKDLQGRYRFEDLTLEVVHVQGDPFAAPSRLAVHVPTRALPLDGIGVESAARRVGVEDALLRSFAAEVARGGERRGSGRSGRWGVAALGQEILARTGCEIVGEVVTLRLTAGLPADGRRVLGRQAWQMLGEELPRLVERGVLEADFETLLASASANEDQEALRAEVVRRGWVAFIGEGAVLPRRSGVDDRPLEGAAAVPWATPPELRATVRLPNAGEVEGAAVPAGVTLICGGGYHGKSTLLKALERGVYNHIPGDGRERCATAPGAVYVRAEDGRAVTGVDISPFIGELPGGRSTAAFSTENASGSTSQAAAIMEALELGATALLIDEDTSATNFMARDRRMQALVATPDEPITPFVDRVAELRDALGVSCVLVAGGSGELFDVADVVLAMRRYAPEVVTAAARSIAAAHPSGRVPEARGALARPASRVLARGGLDASGRGGRERSRARGVDAITFGEEEIDLRALAQVVDEGQTRLIADLLLAASERLVDGSRTLASVCASLDASLAEGPLSGWSARGYGDRAWVRGLEVGAAINRLRGLRVKGRSG